MRRLPSGVRFFVGWIGGGGIGFTVKVKLNLPKAQEIVKSCGLDPAGDVQAFWTVSVVMRRIEKYMAKSSGAWIKEMINHTSALSEKTKIILPGDRAAMLHDGKVRVDSETGVAGFMTQDGWKSRKGSTKVKSDRDINYNKEHNPLAGPYPERALVANEGDAMTRELQNYIDYKKRGGK